MTKSDLQQPTRIWPGTEDKVELMALRWAAGLSCFQPGDRDMREVAEAEDQRRNALCERPDAIKPLKG